MEVRGKRVTVIGLGRFGGGVGVVRWLAAQGARVLVTDREPAERLERSLAEIAGCYERLRMGGHDDADFRDTDLVIVNPAVPEESPLLAVARDAGVPVSTEINLFVERCPATVVGVTGSVGKSTTTAMLGHVLERCRSAGRTWVGGNLGASLLDRVEAMRADDVVVLELSSFQLQRTPLVRWSPRVALVTNIAPNHLDWHKTFAAYAAAKLNIVRFQDPARDALVIGDDPALRDQFAQLFGDLAGIWRFGLDGATPAARCQSSSAVESDDRFLRWEGVRLRVPGAHNLRNAAAALTAAACLGVDADEAAASLETFAGLPHRLQPLGEFDGVAYYNDSKSSTPEAATTAMEAFDVPLLVILGGYDKGVDLAPAARVAARRARFAACIGTTGARLRELVTASGGTAETFDGLDAAVEACRVRARPGEAVLLSPACASWDMFEDYRQRGERFTALVRAGRAAHAAK